MLPHLLLLVQPYFSGLLRQYPSTSCLNVQATHEAVLARQQAIGTTFSNIDIFE